MSKKYLLGIDNGGTVSKAALFDFSGRQILKNSVQIPMLTPAPGFTQRRMEDIRDKNFELIKSITDACDGEIAAVGNRIDKRFAFKDKGIKIEFYDN